MFHSVGTELQQQGYRNIPNERQVTEVRTYDSNIKTEVGNQTIGVQDPIKKTLNNQQLIQLIMVFWEWKLTLLHNYNMIL